MLYGLVSFGSHSVHLLGSIESSSLSEFQDCIAAFFFLSDCLIWRSCSVIFQLRSGTWEIDVPLKMDSHVQDAYTLLYYRKEYGMVSQKSKSMRREKILIIFFPHNLP